MVASSRDAGKTDRPRASRWPRGGGRAGVLTRRQHLVLLGIFVLALVLRGLYCWGQAEHNPFFWSPTMDEARHHVWAQQIASGEGLGEKPYFRAPLYYVLLGWMYAVAGVKIAVARGIGCVLGAVSCYLIARLGVAFTSFRVGWLAGLIAAVYWPLIYFDAQLLTANLEVFLNLVLLLLLYHAVRRASLWLFLAAGVVWGLSAITRPNVLALAPGILAWLWVGAALAPRRSPKWKAAGVLVAGAAIAILPVTLRNLVVGREWVLIATNGGVNFFIGNNPLSDGVAAVVPGTSPEWQRGYEETHAIAEEEMGRSLSEREVSSYWFRRGLAWIGEEPGAWLAHMVWKFRLFWSPVEIPNNQPIRFFAERSGVSVLFWVGFPVVAVLGLMGVAFVPRAGRGWWLLLMYGALYMGTVVLFFCPGRYRLPVVPVLILLAALTIERVVTHVRERRQIGRLVGAAALGVLAVVFLATNPPPREQFRRNVRGEAHLNLANYYMRQREESPGYVDKAFAHYAEAVRYRPGDWELRIKYGHNLMTFGHVEAAGEQLVRAVELQPVDVEARRVYADYLREAGDLAGAAAQWRVLAEQMPDEALPHATAGALLVQLGEYGVARGYLERAVVLEPGAAEGHYLLGTALLRLGEAEAALVALDEAIALSPDHVEALLASGAVLGRLGRHGEAAERFGRVLAMAPGHAGALRGRVMALREAGRYGEVAEELEAALKRRGEDVELLTQLAWLRATCPEEGVRGGQVAARLAQQAIEAQGRATVRLMDVLAAAYAEAGAFEEAGAVLERAIGALREAGQVERVGELETRLEAYRAGKAWREK